MSTLTLQFSGGALRLKRPVVFSPSHVIVSHVTSLESDLGKIPWKIGIWFSFGTKLIVAYVCYSHDAVHLILPETSCKEIAESPANYYWVAEDIPLVVAQSFVSGSTTVRTGAVNVIDSNNVTTFFNISRFQFEMFLKAWDLDM